MANTKSAAALPKDEAIEDDSELSEVDMGSVFLRPDGYHWQAPDGVQEFGPFATLELALADMGVTDEAVEPGEALDEAEQEMGISDWVDPDTGELAEGWSTPHLHDE